jgi:hypothetical protein
VAISAGRVQISFTSVGGPVDFWILGYCKNQFGGWFYATQPYTYPNSSYTQSLPSLNASLTAPSVFVKANVANFNGTVQIPATDNDYYYLIFANPNPQPVALKFEVNYPTVPVYQQITIYQQPTSTVIQEAVGEAPMGFGIVFYSGLLAAVIGIAMVFVDLPKWVRNRRTNVKSQKNSLKTILACALMLAFGIVQILIGSMIVLSYQVTAVYSYVPGDLENWIVANTFAPLSPLFKFFGGIVLLSGFVWLISAYVVWRKGHKRPNNQFNKS